MRARALVRGPEAITGSLICETAEVKLAFDAKETSFF